MNHIGSSGLFSTAFASGALIADSRLSSNKHSVAVIKAREVMSLNASYKADRRPELLEILSSKMDMLLGFLLSQFKAVPTTEEVRGALLNDRIDALNEDHIVGVPDSLVPMTIVRALMKKHRIAIDPRALNNWTEFQSRYETQVLHA